CRRRSRRSPRSVRARGGARPGRSATGSRCATRAASPRCTRRPRRIHGCALTPTQRCPRQAPSLHVLVLAAALEWRDLTREQPRVLGVPIARYVKECLEHRELLVEDKQVVAQLLA